MRLAVLAVLASACSGPAGPDPILPANYASTYTEVRACRPSIEHGAVNIRVLAAPDALDPYAGRMAPFPTGAIVVKEEYASSDLSCTGPLRYWTVMEKLADGSSPDTIDWHWQKLNASRRVLEEDDEGCISCHAMCNGVDNGGYLYTCTDPP